MTTDTIECPFCAEIIKAKAKKCRYCGEFLEIGLTEEAVLTEFEQQKQAVDVQAEGAPVATAEAQPSAPPVAPAAPPPTEGESAELQAPVVVASEEDDAAATADPLNDLYQKLAQMPDSPERELVIQTLEQLAVETQKGEEAEEDKVEDMVKTVVQVLPDVAEITVNTIINPASGLLTLVQKVAKRAGGGKKEEAQEEVLEPQPGDAEEGETQAPAAAAPVEVDAEAAAEALNKVHEKLEQLPDSAAKELVEQTLQQLDAEPQEDAEKSKVEELVESVAEILPEAVEAVEETVEQVIGSKEDTD